MMMFDRSFRWIKSAIVRDGKLYCIPGWSRGIYEIKLEDWSINRILSLPYREGRYWNLFYIDNIIYCAPHIGKRLYRIIDDFTGLEIVVDQDTTQELVEIMYFDRKMFFFPRDTEEGLFIYDFDTEDIHEDTGWRNQINDVNQHGRINRWFSDGKSLLFITYDNNRIFEYGVESHILKELIVGENKQWHDIISCDEKKYLLSRQDEGILCVENRGNSQLVTNHSSELGSVKKLVVLDSSTIVLESHNSMQVLKEGRVLGSYPIEEVSGSNFIECIDSGDYYILLPWVDENFYCIFKENLSCERHRFKLSMKEKFLQGEIFFEEEKSDLKEFIDEL